MRALWPEELAESGRIKKNGYAWRIVKKLENRCLKNAAAIVSLTHAAVLYLNDVFPNHDIEAKTTVIPTCANLTDFNYLDKEVSKSENKIILSCVGSVLSGWFKLDYLNCFHRVFQSVLFNTGQKMALRVVYFRITTILLNKMPSFGCY